MLFYFGWTHRARARVLPRPSRRHAVVEPADLPGPPDTLAFAESAVEHIVRTGIRLAPVTLENEPVTLSR